MAQTPKSVQRRQTSEQSLGTTTKLPEIHLSGSDAAGIFETELRNSKIGGILRDHRPAHACNIIESALESFSTEKVDFTRCDFKDNAIRSCHFLDSKFDSNTFAYNAVVGTLFEQCSFNDSDIQQCDFEQTVFLGCDFRNLLVKACTFLQCEFRDCVTNNKVFETCRLSDCAFSGTELQAQSIAENFGVTSSQYDGVLRDDRSDSSHRKLTKGELAHWARQFAIHPLQRLSVDYFRSGTLLGGSQILDTCFTVETWVPRSRTAGSFALVLSRWSEFLIWLYERDQLVIHTLLRLHSTTDTLIQALESLGTHTPWISQVRGVHLSLARLVDHYLILLEESVGRIGNELFLLVEGGSSEEWYRSNLKALFDRAPDAKIRGLVKRNSPWDLNIVISHGSILLFMALFLATRTRLQLLKHADRFVRHAEPSTTVPSPKLIKVPATKGDRAKANAATRPILSLEFGGQQALRSTPSFRLQAYLPGNLIGDLQLDLSSRHVGKLRKIIKDML